MNTEETENININQSDCIKEVDYITYTKYINVCTYQETIVKKPFYQVDIVIIVIVVILFILTFLQIFQTNKQHKWR